MLAISWIECRTLIRNKNLIWFGDLWFCNLWFCNVVTDLKDLKDLISSAVGWHTAANMVLSLLIVASSIESNVFNQTLLDMVKMLLALGFLFMQNTIGRRRVVVSLIDSFYVYLYRS